MKMNSMKTAPKDGTPVLLKFKDDLKQFSRNDEYWEESFSGIFFVGRNNSDKSSTKINDCWSFAAPVGHGGIPDIWLEGWEHLPDKLKSCPLYTDYEKSCQALKQNKIDNSTDEFGCPECGFRVSLRHFVRSRKEALCCNCNKTEVINFKRVE